MSFSAASDNRYGSYGLTGGSTVLARAAAEVDVGNIVTAPLIEIAKTDFRPGLKGLEFGRLKRFALLDEPQPLPEHLACILIAPGTDQGRDDTFMVRR